MRHEIEEALKKVESKVFFGGSKLNDHENWDCIVFGRRKKKKSGNTGEISTWFVAIIKEEFIPDGVEEKVIEMLRGVGLKKSDDIAEYGYVEKSGECAVEICTMEFYKTVKGC